MLVPGDKVCSAPQFKNCTENMTHTVSKKYPVPCQSAASAPHVNVRRVRCEGMASSDHNNPSYGSTIKERCSLGLPHPSTIEQDKD